MLIYGLFCSEKTSRLLSSPSRGSYIPICTCVLSRSINPANRAVLPSPQLSAVCTARYGFQGFAEVEAACLRGRAKGTSRSQGTLLQALHPGELWFSPGSQPPAHHPLVEGSGPSAITALHQCPGTSWEWVHQRREVQTSRACWQEGLCPWTLCHQQMHFVLREGLSIHLWDHGALGGCEPGAEPEPGALIGQAFLLPAGVWTKT